MVIQGHVQSSEKFKPPHTFPAEDEQGSASSFSSHTANKCPIHSPVSAPTMSSAM